MKLLEVYKEKLVGTIKGLDRVRFRGTLRWLSSDRGLNTFVNQAGILFKDFKSWAEKKTHALRSSCEERTKALGIPMIYLNSSDQNKEQLARQVAKDRGVGSGGSICMLSVVEPCFSPSVSGDKQTKKLELTYRPRKCIHFYHYFDHPQFGFGHVRLQSWLPYGVSICINGRHWLEKQLLREKTRFVKKDNCFIWLEDVARAQKLMDEQLKTKWPVVLDSLLQNICPQLPGLLSPLEFDYYWSAEETEWATDLMFSSDFPLEQIYPRVLRHGMMVSDSPAVMRYLNRGKQDGTEKKPGALPESVITDYRRRHEGVRVKHWINGNSIKVYNKAPTLLRIETTINSTREFRVFRHPEDDPERSLCWLPLRKGVSDLHRRCQISNRANDRYIEALGMTLVEDKLKEVLGPACQRIKKEGKSYRALNPWSPEDFRLLSFFSKGEHTINGFRNKNMRKYLYGEDTQASVKELRRKSSRVSRLLGLLRAHGLIRKTPKTNRYVPTEKGRRISTALLYASEANVARLTDLAA